MQIMLIVAKELIYRQDSVPDWLNESSRKLVILIQTNDQKLGPDWLHKQEIHT